MKKKRQAELLAIIRENHVDNQETLSRMLADRGFPAAQATISRDINELNIEKTMNENGVVCYVQASGMNNVRFESIFRQAVISIDSAMNIVCVKCHSGLASAACAALDGMNLSFVVGTIAGDDTVFILVRTEEDARKLCVQLKQLSSGA